MSIYLFGQCKVSDVEIIIQNLQTGKELVTGDHVMH